MTTQLKAKIPKLDLTEAERKSVFPNQQINLNLPVTYGPVFLATDAVWDRLQHCSQYAVSIKYSQFEFKQGVQQLKGQGEGVQHWIFVPSYNRHADEDPRQMRIDWADAVSHTAPYVRVVVVRSDEDQVKVSVCLMHL